MRWTVQEIERLINEGFAVLKQLSTSYADIYPWAKLFKNKTYREVIDREVRLACVTQASLLSLSLLITDLRGGSADSSRSDRWPEDNVGIRHR